MDFKNKLTNDPFAEFGGTVANEDQFKSFGGNAINNDPFAEFSGGQIGPPTRTVAKKDNVTMVRQPIKPRPQQEIDKENYFNPPVKDNITSGDKSVDFLYHNQWLMNTPIIGGYIKDKAKDIASKSGGGSTVNMQQSKDNTEGNLSPTANYNGAIGEGKPLAGASVFDQFFSDKPLLQQSKYKPTSDYYGFLPSYSIKGDFDKQISNGKSITQDDFKDALYNTLHTKTQKDNNGSNPDEAYNKFIKTKQPVYTSSEFDEPFTRMLGQNLAGHKVGLAWDTQKNLPYVSISDAWDFEPRAYAKKWEDKGNTPQSQKAYIQASLMQKAGKPFKVYDRFYFDPKTRQYIPDDKLPK